KRPTKASAFARREKAAQNPPKKPSRKPSVQSDAAETAHPEPEDMEVEIQGEDVVREMEDDELVREVLEQN
ncbi:hypothetical protein A2U01_0084683, partial [Trifolium medium]|nr:hypothetical protein [Trifolium medium]